MSSRRTSGVHDRRISNASDALIAIRTSRLRRRRGPENREGVGIVVYEQYRDFAKLRDHHSTSKAAAAPPPNQPTKCRDSVTEGGATQQQVTTGRRRGAATRP